MKSVPKDAFQGISRTPINWAITLTPRTPTSAYSPDDSGCVAVGDTEEETRRNFQDALIAHFQAMSEVGEPIPEPHTSVDYVEVAA